MGVRTRSATSSPVKKAVNATKGTTSQAPAQADPLHLLILPGSLSPEARILSLPSPRDRSKKRFLFCPSQGLFEFTKLAAPPTEYRSILFAPTEDGELIKINAEQDESAISHGYVQKDTSFLVATPFDLLFLLLPLLPSTFTNSGKTLFQPLDDLFESQIAEDSHLRHLIQNGTQIVGDTMSRFCDTVDAGDEKMFRVSEDKILSILHSKAEAMLSQGLPPSMEERFITRALEKPVLSIKREETRVSTVSKESAIGEFEESKSESFDSQSMSASSVAPSVFSEVSVTSSVTTVAPEAVSTEITRLMRRKVALDFIFASHFSSAIAEHLRSKIMQDKSLADFEPLETHLKHLASLRADALASRSLGDFSRKRGNADDDEEIEQRAEKKQKIEEEKRKKANQSRGVKELSKVNISGMKKMGDFFSKKPLTAKAKS